VDKPPSDPPARHVRRVRYPGRNPREFSQKYKELDPDRYAAEVDKVRAAGKTPAGTHVPILVDEVLAAARPAPGDVVVDCTLGGGGHTRLMLDRILPGGRLIGLDVDPVELPRTERRLRAAGYGPDVLTVRRSNFAGLAKALAAAEITSADIVIADLGVSSMQLDNPERGFSHKGVGPLDMRMNPSRGEPASALLARVTEDELAMLLDENADEPHAALVASLLKQKPLTTTHAAERAVRTGLEAALPSLSKADVKVSIRRTFQALRIAVNDEFAVLDALLRSLPACLSPGGRAVVITFHSGEDRRVKKAFQSGARDGVYAAVATEVIRPSMEETRANRRASSAKLRWAVRT
jgi:16S rRNA (cytosine1402-N4)-methyltransferase